MDGWSGSGEVGGQVDMVGWMWHYSGWKNRWSWWVDGWEWADRVCVDG